MKFDLLEKCNVIDYHQIWVKDNFSEITSEFKSKEEQFQSRLDRLREHLIERFEELTSPKAEQKEKSKQRIELFRYSAEE